MTICSRAATFAAGSFSMPGSIGGAVVVTRHPPQASDARATAAARHPSVFHTSLSMAGLPLSVNLMETQGEGNPSVEYDTAGSRVNFCGGTPFDDGPISA